MTWFEKVRKAALWGRYFALTAWHLILVPYGKRTFFRAPWPELWKHVRAWTVLSHRNFGITIDFRNPQNVPLDRQYILMANHRSWFDQLALGECYPQPFHCLTKKGYCDYPIFGYALTEFAGAIPVENKGLQADTKDKLLEYLERGDTVLMFVEGTRGSGRTLLPFRAGAFRYAAKTGVPVLPLHIFGTEQILSKQKSLLTVEGGRAILIVDQPRAFTLDNLSEEMEAFERDYREKHEAMYDQYTPRAISPENSRRG